jgi:hypothetical protein
MNTTNTTSRRGFFGAAAAAIAGPAAIGASQMTTTLTLTPTSPATSVDRAEFLRRCEAANRVAHSHGSILLTLIMADVDHLRGRISEWLDTHGSECKCEFCTSAPGSAGARGEYTEYDLRGLDWALQQGEAILNGESPYIDDDEIKAFTIVDEDGRRQPKMKAPVPAE